MGPLTQNMQLYRDLADAYERLGQVTMRDRFLMLAADAALQLGYPQEAERLRQRLLAASRHHMLRPYASFVEAATASDVQTYLRDLRLNYPPDVAEQMLASLQGGEGQRLDQTQPLPPLETPRAVPMTAPLMDLSAAPVVRARQPRPLVPDADPYPLAATVPAPKPRSPAERPPSPAPAPAPVEPIRVERVLPPERQPRNKAAWLNAVLMLLAVLAALAVAALTVARPFLPEGLLR
jgi:hypothetical protein